MNLDNHPKRKIIDDVSISEILKMREDGRSNQEIADALGAHYATVTRHIGRQGFRAPNKTRKPQHTSEQGIPYELKEEMDLKKYDVTEMEMLEGME